MKLGLLAVLALSFLLAADQPAAKEARQELEKLQGTWRFVSLEIDGQALPEGALKDAKIVIKGDAFDSSSFGIVYTGTVKVDPTQNPKTIDLAFNAGPEKGNTTLGIYELDGDTLRLCLALNKKERPKEFSSKPGSGLALEKLKREKQ